MSAHKFTKEMNKNSIENFFVDLSNGHATEVFAAFFRENGVQHRFYRIFGEIVKISLDTNSSSICGFFIAGDDREMFEANYGKK